MAETDLQQMPFGFEGPPGSVRGSRPPETTKFDLFQESLRARESTELEIYEHNGILHGGVGHKLVGDELKKYKAGDPISEELSKRWLKEDSKEAWKSAGKKAKKLGNPDLQSTLAPLDFQLGVNWHKDHKKTWKLLKKGDYKGAAKEVEDSKWFEQSPTRVEDFQQGMYEAAGMLRVDGSLKSERGYLGPMENTHGETMTEFSTDLGDEAGTPIPTMVPTQRPEALEYMQNMPGGQGFNFDIPIEAEIVRVAREHARQRIQQGKSAFYQDGEELEDRPTLGTSSVLNGN